MPYNNKLDEKVFSKVWENDSEKLTVSVHSYNKGQKKLQISRENKNTQGAVSYTHLTLPTKRIV